jgi:hypothetical protein
MCILFSQHLLEWLAVVYVVHWGKVARVQVKISAFDLAPLGGTAAGKAIFFLPALHSVPRFRIIMRLKNCVYIFDIILNYVMDLLYPSNRSTRSDRPLGLVVKRITSI